MSHILNQTISSHHTLVYVYIQTEPETNSVFRQNNTCSWNRQRNEKNHATLNIITSMDRILLLLYHYFLCFKIHQWETNEHVIRRCLCLKLSKEQNVFPMLVMGIWGKLNKTKQCAYVCLKKVPQGRDNKYDKGVLVLTE